MADEIKLPHHLADIICQYEEVCDGEGIGPPNVDTLGLMQWIGKTYPDLKDKYSWLWCFRKENNDR